MLSREQILKAINNNDIYISDYDEKRLNPNSYNLRLSNKLLIYTGNVIDSKKNNNVKEIIIPESGLLLEPNKLYLGSTIEETHSNKFIPCISGRSSIGRLGINIHATAGFGDIGFKGHWTLEIFVVQPTIIYPNMEICQIYFFSPLMGTNSPNGVFSILWDDKPQLYNGKYQNQEDVKSSELYKEFK